MQILQKNCSKLSQIDPSHIQKSLNGKWLHYNRVYLAKVDAKYLAVSFTIFERIAATFAQIIDFDFYAWRLQGKDGFIVCHDYLENWAKKASAASSVLGQNKSTPTVIPLTSSEPAPKNEEFTLQAKMTVSFSKKNGPERLIELTKALEANPQLVEELTLEGIEMVRNELGIDLNGLKAFAQVLPKLNLLSLDIQCSLGERELAVLMPAIAKSRTLNQLKLKHCELTDTGLKAIQNAIQSSTSLEALELKEAPSMENQIFFSNQTSELIAKTGTLKRLTLNNYSFVAAYSTFNNAKLVEALWKNTDLKELYIKASAINIDCIFAIGSALHTNGDLETLSIEAPQLSNFAVLSIFSALKDNTTLKSLRLIEASDTPFSDDFESAKCSDIEQYLATSAQRNPPLTLEINPARKAQLADAAMKANVTLV